MTREELKTRFAEKLRARREELGMTQEQIGKEAGCSGVSIGYYEKGERIPDIYTALKISECCRISFEELIGVKTKTEKIGEKRKAQIVAENMKNLDDDTVLDIVSAGVVEMKKRMICRGVSNDG